jgi:hypothetical protein
MNEKKIKVPEGYGQFGRPVNGKIILKVAGMLM